MSKKLQTFLSKECARIGFVDLKERGGLGKEGGGMGKVCILWAKSEFLWAKKNPSSSESDRPDAVAVVPRLGISPPTSQGRFYARSLFLLGATSASHLGLVSPAVTLTPAVTAAARPLLAYCVTTILCQDSCHFRLSIGCQWVTGPSQPSVRQSSFKFPGPTLSLAP